jgi:predicted amidohydrolase YtcJ
LFENGVIYIDSSVSAKNLLIDGSSVKGYDVDKSEYPDAMVIDLDGKTIFPGFMDTHCHLLESGFLLKAGVNLDNIRNSTQEIAERIKEKIALSKPRDIILGIGFWMDDCSTWSLDDLAIIDSVSPDNPVMVLDMTGHNLVVNTQAMNTCNITYDNTPNSAFIGRDEQKEKLTGMFREKEMQRPADCIFNKFGHDEIVKAGTKEFLDKWAGMGYTGIVDLMGAPGFRLDKPDIFLQLEEDGELNVRVNYCYTLFDIGGVAKAVELKGKDTELVKFYGGKIFIDGSFAGGEAWTSWEHSNGGFGSPQITKDELKEIVKEAERQNLNMHYHTQGDEAIQAVLDSLEYAKEAFGEIKATHTLAHVAFVRDEQIQTIVGYGGKVVVTVQPSFWEIEDNLVQYYEGHLDEVYRIKPLMDAGVVVGMSTDFSVSPEPYTPPPVVMSIAMKGASNPDIYKPLTAQEVVKGYTQNNAKVCVQKDLGSLHIGNKADFVIYEGDYYKMSADEISKNPPKVVETWVNGEVKFFCSVKK